jgi:hypothetical protein
MQIINFLIFLKHSIMKLAFEAEFRETPWIHFKISVSTAQQYHVSRSLGCL